MLVQEVYQSLESLSLNELKKLSGEFGLSTTGNRQTLINRLLKNKLPSKIDDPVLYHKIRERIKKQVKTWPSAYASGLVVQAYKKAGGTYSGKNEGGLDRWYREKWVNICETDSKNNYLACSSSDSKRYPYCRPSVRINKNTPKTVTELTTSQKEKMCHKKKGRSRVYL